MKSRRTRRRKSKFNFPLALTLAITAIAAFSFGLGSYVSHASVTLNGSGVSASSTSSNFLELTSSTNTLFSVDNQGNVGANQFYGDTVSTTPVPNLSFTSGGGLNLNAGGTNQDLNLNPSGTGATVATNLEDKGGQVFNVKAYGAKGDGVTNDTAAVQAAQNAAGPKPLYFPPGNYIITGNSLSIPEYARWEGSNRFGTTITLTGTGGGACTTSNTNGLFVITKGSDTFSNLTFQPQNGTAGTCVVRVGTGAEVSWTTFDNVRIYGGSINSTNINLFTQSIDTFNFDNGLLEYGAELVESHYGFIRVSFKNTNFSYNTDSTKFMVELGASTGGLAFSVSFADDVFEMYGSNNAIHYTGQTPARVVSCWFGDNSALSGTLLSGGAFVAYANWMGANSSIAQRVISLV